MERIEHIPDVEDGPDFSRLEATLVSTNIAARPISRDGQHQQRHATINDITVDELENDYDFDSALYPLETIDSVHDLFPRALFHKYVSEDENFSRDTKINCLSVDYRQANWLQLDELRFAKLIEDASERCINVPVISASTDAVNSTSRKALIFFVPLELRSKSSFGYAIPITQANIQQAFDKLHLNPAFLQNLLGRPDYWGTQQRWDKTGKTFLGCDFWCQHPRWNLQVQGAPVSVYCKYDFQRDLIIYMISHKSNDTVIKALRELLDPLVHHEPRHHICDILLDSPLDIHAMISSLNFEASKWHVARFRRFQWDIVNKVDDHLAGKDQHDRTKLMGYLKQLQVVSQNSDSHLANAQVFLFTARGIREMVAKLNVSRNEKTTQRTIDLLEYLIQSMEKQHMWFLNYKSRKDGVMTLVFHFNQQADAMTNFVLSKEMKKDSTSMNAIAGLTMIFLPGTFIASVLSSDIFKSEPRMRSFEVTGLWWLWLVTTFPITFVTVLTWWFYKEYMKKQGMQPEKLVFKIDSDLEIDSLVQVKRKLSIIEMLKGYLLVGRKKSVVSG